MRKVVASDGSKDYLDYAIVGVLCTLIFIMIYGVRVINPLNTDWLMSLNQFSPDLAQHYIGWKAFRNSSWQFPIGLMDTLSYPSSVSVIFSDPIPLFAVFFKILSPILPKDFQYFGIWSLLSFILQGIFAARIIKNYSASRVATIISSTFFVLAPALFARMFFHSALASHWIILFGLEPVFSYKKYQNNNKLFYVVALMGFLSASIHIYFVLMSGIILLGICLMDILNSKRFIKTGILLGIYILSTVLTTWLLGGFSSGMNATNSGLGLFSFNLYQFLYPADWSAIMKDMYLWSEEQSFEGYAYLGVGYIILTLLGLFSMFDKCDLKTIWKRHKNIFLSLAVIFVIALIFACSPRVTFKTRLLFDYTSILPGFIVKAWSVFRASGRVAWIGVYIIMLCSTILICKLSSKKLAIATFVFVFAVQVYELRDRMGIFHSRFAGEYVYNSRLVSDAYWNKIADSGKIKRIIYCSNIDFDYTTAVTDWALNNDMTVNEFYFARSAGDAIEQNKQKALAEMPEDTIFIFTPAEKDACLKYDLHYYDIDGLIIGSKSEFNGIPELNFNIVFDD